MIKLLAVQDENSFYHEVNQLNRQDRISYP